MHVMKKKSVVACRNIVQLEEEKLYLKHCLQYSKLWQNLEYPGNYTYNTLKINPSTVLAQEITNKDHNYC
jgi:hypothetical protein